MTKLTEVTLVNNLLKNTGERAGSPLRIRRQPNIETGAELTTNLCDSRNKHLQNFFIHIHEKLNQVSSLCFGETIDR